MPRVKTYKYEELPEGYPELMEEVKAASKPCGIYFSRDFEYPWVVKELRKSRYYKPGNKVLDIGSGCNPVPFYLKQQGLDVWCIDEQDLSKFYEDAGINFVKGSSADADGYFQMNSFALIYSISVFEHMLEDTFKRTIAQVFLLLKSKGRFIATMDIRNSIQPEGFYEDYKYEMTSYRNLKLLKHNMLTINGRPEVGLFAFYKRW